MSDVKFGCRVDAFSETDRRRHSELCCALDELVREAVALDDGFALRYEESPATWRRLEEWSELEGTCCPFLTIITRRDSERGSIWLQLTGPDGVKAFLAPRLRASR